VNWGIEWLDRNQLHDGIPEESGIGDVSLFQNALAITALSRIIQLQQVSEDTRAVCRQILEVAVQGSLYNALPNCTWPRQTHLERTSPAKTALLHLALQEAHSFGLVPDHVQFAGAIESSDTAFELFVKGGGLWLAANAETWRGLIEADPDVTGTQWHHLAYALCLEATLRSGVPITESVATSWNELLSWWDSQRHSWCEPTNPRLATIRADYAAVSTMETLLAREGELGIEKLRLLAERSAHSVDSTLGALFVTPLGQFGLVLRDGTDPVHLELTETLERLLRALAEADDGSGYLRPDEIATHMNAAPGSVGKFVQRLNTSVAKQIPSQQALVVSSRNRGYRLNVHAVRRSTS
jgi:hypothetical protein